MSKIAALLLAVAAPASPAASPLALPAGGAQVAWWNPTADYVTVGQDEPGYRAWTARAPARSIYVSAFHQYLTGAGVAYVVPTWQLLRTASDWQRCGAEPFEMPPIGEWANVVNTLRYVRDYVVPAVGPVEAVSAYRNPVLNRCAGGAANSVHQHLSALDLVPLRPTNRDEIMARLCPAHAAEGPRYSVGLGFYAKLRFHVDSWKFRTWGRNDHGGLACPRSYQLAHASDPPSGTPVAASVSTSGAPKIIYVPPAGATDPLAPRE
jgi:hypothetical protein